MAASSVTDDEVARFEAIADEWWDPAGKFAPLHTIHILGGGSGTE